MLERAPATGVHVLLAGRFFVFKRDIIDLDGYACNGVTHKGSCL